VAGPARTILFCLPLAAWALVALPGRAEGQIYKWQDAKGQWMYSDHLPTDGTPSYRIPGTTFRSTRPADARLANSYDQLIEKHAATYSVAPQLVRAVVQVESGFNARAVSREGAMGLMQLMPATAIEMGVRDPFDPDENIRGGVAYLRQLLNRYGGDEVLALAAYNAGPEAIDRHGYQVPPYRETQRYVSQVTGRSGSSTVAHPIITGRRAAAPRSRAPAAVKATVVYKWWERTKDGRLIPKFSDTKPALGTSYEIVR
jgi:soluble lytic murein transglycosylase